MLPRVVSRHVLAALNSPKSLYSTGCAVYVAAVVRFLATALCGMSPGLAGLSAEMWQAVVNKNALYFVSNTNRDTATSARQLRAGEAPVFLSVPPSF